MPREKLTNPPDWMIWESGEHVGEPGARVDVVELGGLDQRVDGGGAPPALIRRDVMMPGVWDARLRFAIHFIRFVDGCHWSLPISFMTVVTI
jgi:hypothetical protein